MSRKLVEFSLSADLAASGSVAVSYPPGTNAGSFVGAHGHKFVTGANDVFAAPKHFTLTFGTSNITVNWGSSSPTIASGTTVFLQLEMAGFKAQETRPVAIGAKRTAKCAIVKIDLGAPDTADNDAFVKAATSTELPNAETVTYTPDTDGTSPTDGVGTVVTIGGVDYWELDVPRNVFVNTTHASSIVAMTVKVTGLDEYGKDMYEEISVAATGTNENDQGVKAFKWIRSIAFTAAGNAEANTSNVGFGDVLGLPVFMPGVDHVLLELEDNATATAGTFVAGNVSAAQSATSADVRGTYDPNSAADGSKKFTVVLALPDPDFLGFDQYAG